MLKLCLCYSLKLDNGVGLLSSQVARMGSCSDKGGGGDAGGDLRLPP